MYMYIEQVYMNCSDDGLNRIVAYDSDVLYMLSSVQSYIDTYQDMHIIYRRASSEIVGYIGVNLDNINIFTHLKQDVDCAILVELLLTDKLLNSFDRDYHTNNVLIIKQLLLQGCKVVNSLTDMTFRKEKKTC